MLFVVIKIQNQNILLLKINQNLNHTGSTLFFDFLFLNEFCKHEILQF